MWSANPGAAEVELEVTPDTRRLALPTLCSGGPRGTWTHLAINGEEVSWGPGSDDGHLWRPVDTTTGALGGRELVAPAHAAPETLVGVYFSDLGGATAVPVRNGRRTDAGFAGGTGSTFARILYGEGTAGARITDDPGPRALLGVARHERID